jgi:type IV secretion system protein VirD4
VIAVVVAAGIVLILAALKFGVTLGLVMFTAAAAAVLFARWAWWPSSRLPRHRVRHMRWRLRLRLHPGRGHATLAELHARWGRLAAFRHSGRVRQSMNFWDQVKAPTAAYSVLLGRGHYRHGLRIPLQEHAVIMAPPRQGKTGWLARVILHYPGPVLSTTTKADVHELTAAVRARRGPLAVFNPQAIGNVPSTFAWDPIPGCEHPATAIRRADAFFHGVSVQGVEDSSFWRSSASAYLRVYFHAAAVAGGDLRLVRKWVLGAGPGEAEAILCRAGGDQWWALELAQLQGTASKTIETIRITMTRALGFMADPALAASVLPGPGRSLDIPRFLAASGTLYMIAEADSEDAPLAPLFAAFAAEVHKTAARAGARMPGGRLDPPLLLALDEVTQISPVPLPSWLADSGGKGIQIVAVCHGVAQLKSRWQANGARVVLDTAGVKLFLRGIDDPDTLEMASKLAGQAALADGDGKWRQEIMPPDLIRQLPDRCALVIRSGLAPVVARLQMVWQDRTYKRSRRTVPVPAVTAATERLAITAAPHRALTAAHPGRAAAEPLREPVTVPAGPERAPEPAGWWMQ